jgi:integrase
VQSIFALAAFGWQKPPFKEQAGKSPFLFPSPVMPDKPITSVRKAWKTTLKNAKVPYFPIYHLRHVFCTRLSWVAPDAVVQRAMRHSSPETKRHYQLGMVEQVRQNLEKANERVYGKGKVLRIFMTVSLSMANCHFAHATWRATL